MHVVGHPLIEALGTMRTGILLSVSVDLQVTAEISPIVEYLSALRTFGSKFFRTLMNRPAKNEHVSKKVKIKNCV